MVATLPKNIKFTRAIISCFLRFERLAAKSEQGSTLVAPSRAWFKNDPVVSGYWQAICAGFDVGLAKQSGRFAGGNRGCVSQIGRIGPMGRIG